jgi:nucleoside-diphosphate-sugar epimerase
VVGVNWVLRKLGMGSALLTRTRVRDFTQRSWMVDSGRAGLELGWKPAWTLAEGVTDLTEWYQQTGWL